MYNIVSIESITDSGYSICDADNMILQSYLQSLSGSFVDQGNVYQYIYDMHSGYFPIACNKTIDKLESNVLPWFSPMDHIFGSCGDPENFGFSNHMDYYGIGKARKAEILQRLDAYPLTKPKSSMVYEVSNEKLICFSCLYTNNAEKPIEIDYPMSDNCYYVISAILIHCTYDGCTHPIGYPVKTYKIRGLELNLWEFPLGE